MTDQGPHLDEGRSAAPGISPGVVSDCEYLLRELYFPEHVEDEAGHRLNERAIPVKDLIKRGVSVHRKKYVSAERIRNLTDERLGRPRKGVARQRPPIETLLLGAVITLLVSRRMLQAVRERLRRTPYKMPEQRWGAI